MSEPAPVLPDSETPQESSGEAELTLWRAFKATGSRLAREDLFNLHQPFARNIARRHYRERTRGDLDIHDLQQLAYTGLLEALDRYDPSRGAPFRPFASHRISGAIRDGLSHMNEVREQLSWTHRARRERMTSLTGGDTENLDAAQAMVKLADIAVGLAIGFMLEGTGLYVEGEEAEAAAATAPPTAYDSLVWKETVAQLQAEIAILPERERTILREHYLNGLSFDQLTDLLGLSKGRISQIHRAALLLLRKRMGEHGFFRLGR
jgi:RNA polymerase sigma factor for flagellar operon FliA